MKLIFLSAVSLIAITGAISAADVRYIPATRNNARLADGSPLPVDLASSGWKLLPEEGNEGVFEALPAASGIQPRLLILATGLEPGKAYEVFGFFWSGGFDETEPEVISEGRRPARFGLCQASLLTYDARPTPRMPWMLTPGSQAGRQSGLGAALEEEAPLANELKLITRNGVDRLVRAELGVATAAPDGTLPVFAAAFSYDIIPGRSRIDGIAVRPASPEKSDTSLPPAQRLILAIRAGDKVTASRLLEAGVVVNTPDEEGVMPLFYAAAIPDAALVRALLDHGADPNHPLQSLLPLTAAATAGSAEVTKILLDAGAKVPEKPLVCDPLLICYPDPPLLHPVVAAIRAGSLPVLSLLMDQVPNLAIDSLVPDPATFYLMGTWDLVSPYLVEDAINMGYGDVAGYLIDHACSLAVEDYSLVDWYSGSRHPHAYLMVRATCEGESGMPALEAMMRRGLNPIIQKSAPSDHVGYDYTIFPWDVLSAAARKGDATLVRRFLPAAAGVDKYYQESLLTIALFSGNPEVIGMVQKQFPQANPPRWKPEPKNGLGLAFEDATLRQLLPRTSPKPLQAVPRKVGEHVLAVISAPEAAGPGAALSALASGLEGWVAVDRDEIESTLSESTMRKPWLDGEHSFAELGDKLAADVLVIASFMKGKSFGLYQFEAVDVASGLAIHREYFKDKDLNPGTDLLAFLERTGKALESAAQNGLRQTVTLVSLSADETLPNSLAVERELRASVEREIDATPGMISQGRGKASRLVEEQAMKGNNSILGAAHLIEGHVSPSEANQVKLTLRLETLRDERRGHIDIEKSGDRNAIPELVAETWRELIAQAQPDAAVPQPAAPEQASREATRLLREAGLLFELDRLDQALGLVEAAAALGAPPRDLIPLHLECLYSIATQPITDSSRLSKLSGTIRHLPLSANYSDRVAYSLPAMRDLLQQSSLYFDRHGKEAIGWFTNSYEYRGNEFWFTIQFLSFVRAAIFSDQIPPAKKLELEVFGRELDSFTAAFFKTLTSVRRDDYFSLHLELPDERVFLRNPSLTEGLSVARLSNIDIYGFAGGSRSGESDWFHPERVLAKVMLAKLAPLPATPERMLRKAEIEIILAIPAERPAAVHRLIRARAAALVADRSAAQYWRNFSGLIGRHTASLYFYKTMREGSPTHGHAFLADLIHEPLDRPDFSIRHSQYAASFCAIGSSNTATPPQRNASNASKLIPEEFLQVGDSCLRYPNPDGIRKLLDAAGLWDLATGSSYVKFLANRYPANTLTPAGTEPAAPSVRLLADLRKQTDSTPGLAHNVMVDPANPSLLWLHYSPYQGGIIPTSFNLDFGAGDRRQPWLVAVNCADGSISQKINLATAPGLSQGLGLETSPIPFRGQYNLSFAQSKDTIVTNVCWGDSRAGGKTAAGVGINKRTGAMTALPDGIVVSRGIVRGMASSGAVSIGGIFYFLQTSDPARRERVDLAGEPAALYRMEPDGSILALTSYGRRPELSPFDGIDKFPTAILTDGGRLLVVHDTSHMGYFDPKTGEWTMLGNDVRKNDQLITTLTGVEFRSQFMSNHTLRDPATNQNWIIDSQKPLPGRITCHLPGVAERNIPVNLDVPEDFRNSARVVVRKKSTSRSTQFDSVSFDEFAKSEPLPVVILNQTKDDLILALQTTQGYGWYYGGRANRFLPFLWAIPKKDLLESLKSKTGE